MRNRVRNRVRNRARNSATSRVRRQARKIELTKLGEEIWNSSVNSDRKKNKDFKW